MMIARMREVDDTILYVSVSTLYALSDQMHMSISRVQDVRWARPAPASQPASHRIGRQLSFQPTAVEQASLQQSL